MRIFSSNSSILCVHAQPGHTRSPQIKQSLCNHRHVHMSGSNSMFWLSRNAQRLGFESSQAGFKPSDIPNLTLHPHSSRIRNQPCEKLLNSISSVGSLPLNIILTSHSPAYINKALQASATNLVTSFKLIHYSKKA